jgi:hypothetical protein
MNRTLAILGMMAAGLFGGGLAADPHEQRRRELARIDPSGGHSRGGAPNPIWRAQLQLLRRSWLADVAPGHSQRKPLRNLAKRVRQGRATHSQLIARAAAAAKAG